MNSRKGYSRSAGSIATIIAAVLGLGIGSVGKVNADPVGSDSAIVNIFVKGGLNNPRGLKFGPDGYLYVAEGGTGGSDPVRAGCTGVPFPIGPYTGSPTNSQISRIDVLGTVTPWVVGFPSSQTNAASGSLVSGVADVAFVGDTMYALVGSGGCSHGVPSVSNQVARVNPDRSWTKIADLSEWSLTHSVANPEEEDFEPDGTWYSMIAVRGDLYAVEPNHGEIVKVTTSGNVSRLIDISATYGHIVPTAIAYHGNFYVGNLYQFGIPAGSSKVYKITPSGNIKIDANGFSVVTGVAFDGRGRMYVLEAATNPATIPPSGDGQIVRVDQSGQSKVIVSGLTTPTAMTMGPDGNLYVSNVGFGPPPIGLGQIVKVELTD